MGPGSGGKIVWGAGFGAIFFSGISVNNGLTSGSIDWRGPALAGESIEVIRFDLDEGFLFAARGWIRSDFGLASDEMEGAGVWPSF